MAQFNVGTTYSFDVYAPQILGSSFKNVVLMLNADYESAAELRDVEAIHAQIFPLLPAGTPNNPAAYPYIRVKTSSGAKVVLGVAWIRQDSIVSTTSDIADVVVSNITVADLPKIKNALLANGYENVEVTLRKDVPVLG